MRKERKHYTSEEKVTILRRHLLDHVPVSDLCEELGLQPTVFYRWQKEFFEKGAAAFQTTAGRSSAQPAILGRSAYHLQAIEEVDPIRSFSKSGGRCVGRIVDRRRWNRSHLSDPLSGSLFGLEQLLHGHGLVEMVFGLADLFASDKKPHIGVHHVLRPSTTSRVKLCQGDLCGGHALLSSFFTDGEHRLIVASIMGKICKQGCDQRLCRTGWLSVMNSSSTRLALLLPVCRPSIRNRRIFRAAQAIIARTDDAYLWHETRSLRNPLSPWRGRHGRSVSSARPEARSRSGD